MADYEFSTLPTEAPAPLASASVEQLQQIINASAPTASRELGITQYPDHGEGVVIQEVDPLQDNDPWQHLPQHPPPQLQQQPTPALDRV